MLILLHKLWVSFVSCQIHFHAHKHIACCCRLSHSQNSCACAILCVSCILSLPFLFKCRHCLNLRIALFHITVIHTQAYKHRQININSSQPHSNLIAERYQNHHTIVYSNPSKAALNSVCVCVMVCVCLSASLCAIRQTISSLLKL